MAKSLGTAEYDILRHSLAEMRHSAGMTQRELAAELRVSPSWVAKVEIGERRIDLVEFCWFCQALRKDPANAARTIIGQMIRKRR